MKENMDKILARLFELYKSRTYIENELVRMLRYYSDFKKVEKSINSLTDLRGRIEELENICDYEEVKKLRKKAGAE